MSVFKVGDKVRVVEVDATHFYALGLVGRVTEVVEPESDANVYFIRKEEEVLNSPFFAEELTLIEAASVDSHAVQVARLQRQLDIALAALKPFAQVFADWYNRRILDITFEAWYATYDGKRPRIDYERAAEALAAIEQEASE